MSDVVVDLEGVLSAVQSRLKGNIVGYACCVGSADAGRLTYAYGDARTSVDGTPLPFATSTKTGIASVSKFLDALAAIQLLTRGTLPNLDSPIGGGQQGGFALPTPPSLPADWMTSVNPAVKQFTFRDLLTHRTGLPDNGPQDFAGLQQYLSQSDLALTSLPPNKSSYSNVGYALFRILLPIIAGPGLSGYTDDPALPVDTRATNFAQAYARVINTIVFAPVGVTGIEQAGPPADNSYAFGYDVPGTTPGDDWNQPAVYGTYPLPLVAGAGGWFISIEDVAPVLESLNNGDGRILSSAQWNVMQAIGAVSPFVGLGLGLDALTDSLPPGHRWAMKNGGGPGPHGTFSAVIGFFGAPSGAAAVRNAPAFGALFANSDVSAGPDIARHWFYCQQCASLYYADPTTSSGNVAGVCPIGHGKTIPHLPGTEYALATNARPGSEGGWQRCVKCQALWLDVGTAPSVCPADGNAHQGDGVTYFLDNSGASAADHVADWSWCLHCGVFAYINNGPGYCAGSKSGHAFGAVRFALPYASDGVDHVLLDAFRVATVEASGGTPEPMAGSYEQVAGFRAGSVIELFSGDSSQWESANLTSRAKGPTALPSSLCGYAWHMGPYTYKQVAYVHSDRHIHELAIGIGAKAQWTDADLSGIARATGALPADGSPLVGYTWLAGRSKQVAYRDTNGHIHELSYQIPRVSLLGMPHPMWKHADLTQISGANPAVEDSALSGYAWDAERSKQVVYLDAAGHVHELFIVRGSTWKHADLTARTGARAAASGSCLSGYQWVLGESKQVVYLDSEGHIHELFTVQGADWKHADLTERTDSPPAVAGSSLVGYEWSAGRSKQVVYLDSEGHIHELFIVQGADWKHADLTARIGAPPAVSGSALTGFGLTIGTSKQVMYLDTYGFVHQLRIVPGSDWTHVNLTTVSAAPVLSAGSLLSGYEWVTH